MNKAEIKKVVQLRFRGLRKQYNRMGKNFAVEDIHHFRVEIKKLRAFLRMLSSTGNFAKIKLPSGLKDIYRKAGRVRDLQLHKQDIETKDASSDPPAKYLQQLDKRLGEAKRQLKHSIKPEVLADAQKEIEKKLPGQLENTTIGNFANEKLESARKIATGKSIRDNELHMIRKNLKDIIYVAKTFETDLKIPFPYSKWNTNIEKYLTSLADELGKFQDSFTVLSQLKDSDYPALGDGKKWLGSTRRKHRAILKDLKLSFRNKYGEGNHPFPGNDYSN